MLRRRSGDDSFFSVEELRRGMLDSGLEVCASNLWWQVGKLGRADLVEFRMSGKIREWKRLVRARREVVDRLGT